MALKRDHNIDLLHLLHDHYNTTTLARQGYFFFFTDSDCQYSEKVSKHLWNFAS